MIALALTLALCFASSAGTLPPGPLAPAARDLSPGQWLWAPAASPSGSVSIIVSLPLQRLYAYRNGVLIGISTVSTGKVGHETPSGIFQILQKNEEHYSNLYDNSPMPYMQRLTWDGIALHAGRLPGHPASHGCIRLPDAFAQHLFEATTLGATVIVTQDNAVPRLTPRASESGALLAAEDVQGRTFWAPERQPAGPLSILVSVADREIRVVRGGVEIGHGPVVIGRQVSDTEIYLLSGVNAAQGLFQWQRVPTLPGRDATMISAEERSDLRLPPELRRQIATALDIGTTVVVTPDTLRPAAFDQPFEIIAPEGREGPID